MKNVNYKWIALSCTSLGALFSVLSGSTLTIALPVIMKDLNADMGIIMWTIMSYMLSITVLVPTIGRMADMIGRKKLYVWGFVIFTAASLLCAFSNSGVELLLFRIIQSVGGALLMANSAPIITDAFPKNELGKALGINSMIISVASVIGPILGGFLIHYGWRSIFFINVPIGIIGTIWAGLQLRELDILPEHQVFDWKGTITFAVGMLAFLLALSLGGMAGWISVTTMGLLGLAALLAFLFIRIEKRTEQPMLDLRLFQTRILAFAYISNLLNGIARGAVTFLMVFYFQGIKGIDPIIAGILLAPFAVPMMVVSPISGMLSDKYGPRGLSSLGLLISAVGLIGFMVIKPDTPISHLVVWMFIAGMGSGMFFSPNTSSIMSLVPVERRGIAAGVRTMMNNAGNVVSIGIAMATISSSITPQALHGLMTGTQVGSQGIAVAEFVSGLRLAFTISFGVSLLAAFISYLRGQQPVWGESNSLSPENN
ncbi:MAG: MFS transporter [Clostridiales bacterium]|jgi:EmrB/QacA subfamily drug resistance transporter|nr:MFS transporter [Eubacteriales bacterium]MDH7567412.1 MFS transporter [Clostridiales bacterium]